VPKGHKIRESDRFGNPTRIGQAQCRNADHSLRRCRAYQVRKPLHDTMLDLETGLVRHQECHRLIGTRQRLERQDEMTTVTEAHRVGSRKTLRLGPFGEVRWHPFDSVRLR
jgi:hypothetical protein